MDRNGRTLQRLRVDMTARRFEWTGVDAVSPALKRALPAAEDQRFFEHAGVDWQAAMNAALDNLGPGKLRGASTLTMQLAGMLDPELARADDKGGSRTMAQKLRQARAALQLEKTWSKAQILEAYLNLVTFRGELQGVSAMSHGLFGKAPHGLNTREAAIAAALIRGPNADANKVAERACGLIGPRSPACEGLATEVRQVLARGYEAFPREDAAPHAARRLFARESVAPGARLATTLDADIQAAARRALLVRLTELGGRNVEDGAVVVLDNAGGEVLAYVGSSGELSRASQVDGAAALRQAGSTLKPFLYAQAIERGLIDAASILADAPAEIQTGAGLYVPRNYARTYRGPVSVRAALGGSLNIPAVRTLAMLGPDRFAESLRAIGLESVDKPGDHYGLSLALGSADVTLLALTNAYRALANGGVVSAVRFTQADGPVLPARRVLGVAASHIVADMLADRAARAPAFGMSNPLETPFWSAVKTGTSKDMRDNWAIGFSSRFTVGVWVGNAGGAAIHDVSGVSGAAPIWRDLMLHLHRRGSGQQPARPANVVAGAIRFEPAIEPPRTELFVAGTAREVVRLLPAGATARIESPVGGAIIALHPDIPPANQRLFLVASAPAGAHWELGGRVMGSAARPLAWFPWPGRHLLVLKDASGALLGTASFEVRGARARGVAP